jgi:hypothetical protein
MQFPKVPLALPVLLLGLLVGSANAEWVKDDQSLGKFLIINAMTHGRYAFYPFERNKLVVAVAGGMVYECSDGVMREACVGPRAMTAEEKQRYPKSPTLDQALKDQFLISYPAKERIWYEDIAIMLNEWIHGADLLLRGLSVADEYHLNSLADRLEPRLNTPLTISNAKALVAAMQARWVEGYQSLARGRENVGDDISDRPYVGRLTARLELICGQNRAACVGK